MRKSLSLAGLAGMISVCAVVGTAHATPPKPWHNSMKSIVEQTALVVEGEVTDITTTYDEAIGPRTVTSLSNITVHLGDAERAPNTIELRSFGGPLPDGKTVNEAHVPTFVHGKRYLVFLRNGDWALSPVAGHQAFLVERIAGKPILVDRGGHSVLGVSSTGAVPGFPVFMEREGLNRPDQPLEVNPAIDSGLVKRALGVQEFVVALKEYSDSEGIAVEGTFPEQPTMWGPSWRIAPTLRAEPPRTTTTRPTALSTGVFDEMPAVDRDAMASLSGDELLACFAEPVTLRDTTVEELPICLGGDQ